MAMTSDVGTSDGEPLANDSFSIAAIANYCKLRGLEQNAN